MSNQHAVECRGEAHWIWRLEFLVTFRGKILLFFVQVFWRRTSTTEGGWVRALVCSPSTLSLCAYRSVCMSMYANVGLQIFSLSGSAAWTHDAATLFEDAYTFLDFDHHNSQTFKILTSAMNGTLISACACRGYAPRMSAHSF